MKNIIITFILCIIAFCALGQNSYHEAILQGDRAFQNGQYKKAIDKYFSAIAFEPKKRAVVQKKINRVFDRIQQLQKEAEENAKRAKAAEKKATQALDRIALSEAKRGLKAIEQFRFEEALVHIKNASSSSNTSVQTEVKKLLARYILVHLFKEKPSNWETKLKTLFNAIKQTKSGIEVNFDHQNGQSVLENDFKKGIQKALNGDKSTARKDLIQALRKVIGNASMKEVLNQYNF